MRIAHRAGVRNYICTQVLLRTPNTWPANGAAGDVLLSRQVPLLPAFGRVVGFKASGLARLPLGGPQV